MAPLHTGAGLLTDEQKDRLAVLFADGAHVEVEATWGIYQRMIGAYREEDRRQGREIMVKLIDSISHGVPKALTEVVTLGRTLNKRAADVLAYFDRPGTSNGPTEAINGRLEHLRGSALGFRNLTNYIARSLLETGGFRPQLHPRLEEPVNASAGLVLRAVPHMAEQLTGLFRLAQLDPAGGSVTGEENFAPMPGPAGPPLRFG